MAEFKHLGKLNIQPLEAEFGKLKTDEIIITKERVDHIKTRHPEDYDYFEKHGINTVIDPDIILKDQNNIGTVYMIKNLETTNLNVVARLVLETDKADYKNSVMTFFRIREKILSD